MSNCPKCNNDLITIYGNGWDVDTEFCPKCGYEVELDIMTYYKEDGSAAVIDLKEDEDEDNI